MASTNKTPNYDLPQWVASDPVKMADFNQAMSDIDTNLNLVDTTVASHLADYANLIKRGTWTPSLFIADGANPTYTTRDGVYEKIGDIVYCTFRLQVSGLSGVVGNLFLRGLPFANDATYNLTSGWIGFINGVTGISNAGQFTLTSPGGQSTALQLNYINNTGNAVILRSDKITVGFYISGGFILRLNT